MQLRPYQQEAIDAVYRYLREHDDNPVIVIPTAGGKTPVMATICKDTVGTFNCPNCHMGFGSAWMSDAVEFRES